MNKILLVMLVSASIWAYDITTGGSTGTYIQIGKDIQKYVAEPIGMNMNVLTSNGSVDNMNRLGLNDNIRFAIVQHDVVNVFKNSKKNMNRLIAKNTKVLLPLYNEEIHFIVAKNSSLSKISDIRNKRINAGTEGSGTFTATALIYEELFQSTMNFTNYDNDEALTKLDNGEIDVMVVIAGQPSKFVSSLSPSKYKLLSKESSLRSNNYYTVKIHASSYSILPRDINTFAAKAYLVTYDSSSKDFENVIRKFAKQLRKAMPKLKRNGHNKWNNVDEDLSERLPAGWQYYEPFRDSWKYAKCTKDEIMFGFCNEGKM